MKKLEKMKRSLFCLLLVLAALAVLTACGSKAATAADKIELGQKYLTELNYTEAVASFTEAIKLDPDNIQAYMGHAEAYMALGEYDKALADYRFISGMTEDMPYTRALSYIGQAEVYEKMEQPARAVSDYGLAKALLNASDAGKSENVSEEDVSAKLVQVLYVHAALCETLKNYNTALEDYNDLLELGENTAAKRDEVLSQLGETAEDENGLTDTEEPAAERTAEEPAEEPTEEPAQEQETASESESQSAKEETKQEEPASSSEQPKEEAASSTDASSQEEEAEPEGEWQNYIKQSEYFSAETVNVRYRIGGKDIIAREYDEDSEGVKTYRLSMPLRDAERVVKGGYDHIVFYVPEGTVVTVSYSYKQQGESGQFDITGTERFCWVETNQILSESEMRKLNDADVKMEKSITVQSICQMAQWGDNWDNVWVSSDDGIIFCAQ